MLIELDKNDLMSLVRGTDPLFSIMNHPLISKYGSFTGGHVDRWNWDYRYEMQECSEEELLEMYRLCKDALKSGGYLDFKANDKHDYDRDNNESEMPEEYKGYIQNQDNQLQAQCENLLAEYEEAFNKVKEKILNEVKRNIDKEVGM